MNPNLTLGFRESGKFPAPKKNEQNSTKKKFITKHDSTNITIQYS